MSEPHDVVKLLLARMESHPEEFKIGDGPVHQRWVHYIDMVQDYGNETDKAALNAKLRDIVMDEVHEDALDELMNGPDRRRKEEEDNEHDRFMALALQYAKAQAARKHLIAQQQQPREIVGRSPTSLIIDEYVPKETLK